MSNQKNNKWLWLKTWVLTSTLALCACGGGGGANGGGGNGSVTYTVGGVVTGLSAGSSVTLGLGSQLKTVSADGGFAFPSALAGGSSYAVTISVQPIGQFCSVANASGVVSGNVTNIFVNCVSVPWTQFGTASTDYATSVAVDGSGNVYVAGYTGDALPGQTSAGGLDAFVRKYNPAGTVLWTKQFGTDKTDYGYAIAVDGSGGVYVAGVTLGALPGQTNSGGTDAFVRKYDTNGTVLWTQQFGTDKTDYIRSAAVDGSGNVYVVGYTEGVLPGQASVNKNDAFVRKYDTNGNALWTQQFGTNSDDYGYSVAVDGGGNVVVVGYTQGAFPGKMNLGGVDAFLRKYDPAGTELWTQQFGTGGTDYGNAVAVDGSGNIYVASYTDGALPGQTNAGGVDAFVRKYGADGTALWTQQFGTGNGDYGYAVAVDGSGNPYVSGRTLGAFPDQTNAGGSDVFVRGFDTTGAVLWTRQLGTGSEDYGLAVAISGSGKVHVAGGTQGALPGWPNAGGWDAFVTRLVPSSTPSSSATITSATAETPKYWSPLLIEVVGSNLDATVALEADHCAQPMRLNAGVHVSTANHAWYTCIPDQTGAQTLRLVTSAGGTPLATVAITVPTPVVTLTVSGGASVSGGATLNGTLTLTLLPNQAPLTVRNFLDYVHSGFYVGTVFHRYAPNFVLQGGGYALPANTDGSQPPVYKTPNAAIPLEAPPAGGLGNLAGTVAMARTDALNSATSQFFINLKDNSQLDTQGGGYAVFGWLASSDAAFVTAITQSPMSPQGDEFIPYPFVYVTAATQTQ